MQPVLGCGGGEVVDCGHVLNSEWSRVAGVPVSIPAVALYGCLLALLSFARRAAPLAFQKLLWTFLGCGFLTAGLAALWFVSIQVFVLRHICPWCMGAHACSLALAGIALFRAPLTTAVKQQVGAIAVLAAGFLAAIQLGTEPPEPVFIPAADQPAEDGSDGDILAPPGDAELFAPPTALRVLPSDSARVLPVLGFVVPSFRGVLAGGLVMAGDEGSGAADAKTDQADAADDGDQAAAKPAAPTSQVVKISLGASRQRVKLNVNDWPLVGSPNAKCVFVELFDYTCSHCRANHASITAAMSANGVDAAMIALPVPLNSNCNKFTSSNHAGACELSELAVAVWRCNRNLFPTFHSWMMAAPRTPAAARAYADMLVGPKVLADELASKWPSEFISKHVALYDKAGRGSVPKLLFSDGMVESQVPASWLTKRLLTLQQASAAAEVPEQAPSELQTQGTAAAGAVGRPVRRSGPFTGGRK